MAEIYFLIGSEAEIQDMYENEYLTFSPLSQFDLLDARDGDIKLENMTGVILSLHTIQVNPDFTYTPVSPRILQKGDKALIIHTVPNFEKSLRKALKNFPTVKDGIVNRIYNKIEPENDIRWIWIIFQSQENTIEVKVPGLKSASVILDSDQLNRLELYKQ